MRTVDIDSIDEKKGGTGMGKAMDSKKEAKKTPAKSLKEKKAIKNAKKEEKKSRG